MTPSSLPDAATDRQTVGDILLARAYITEEQLEHAVASQQQSGKPLGQVLVEAGAITRLELASALAEQWSDTATWLGPPADAKERDQRRGRRGEEHLSEGHAAGYAQQLQDAVVELARRVASFEPTLTELKLRVESSEGGEPVQLLDRLEVVQDGVTALARRLDELTDGVERAFTAVERNSAETTEEIDGLTTRIGLLAEQTALEEIRSALTELGGRPIDDEALATRVDTLASHLDDLRQEMLSAVASNSQAAALDQLSQTVAELAGRPQADPEVASRLEELTGRIEALAGTDALDSVRAAVEEIAGRPAGDPELERRLDELTTRLDDTAAALADRVEHGSLTALEERLDELAGRLSMLAGTDAIDAIRATLDELASRPAVTPELSQRLEELSARVDQLTEAAPAGDGDAVVALRAEIEELSSRTASLDPELDRRVDNIVGRLDALHARVEEVAATPVQTDETALEDLRASVQELASRPLADPALASGIDAVSARLAELQQQTDGAATTDDIAAVRAELGAVAANLTLVDELAQRIERVESAATTPEQGTTQDLAETLRVELENRIEAVASRTDGLAEETAGAVGAWASERAALEARIDTLAAELAEARLQATAAPLAASEPAPPAKTKGKTIGVGEAVTGSADSELERLRMAVERINMHLGERERAIADLMRSRSSEIKLEDLAARLAELEQGGGGGGGAATPKKAKAGEPALGGNADMHGELRDLATRIEDAEKAAKADRDKVLTQLERMASSIDWRFRRLESDETDAAA